jgi:hypothetical protein
VFVGASPADLKKDVTTPKKVARDISYLFSPAVPAKIEIHLTPANLTASSWPKKEAPPAPKKAVYRSIADKMFDATFSYREKLIRENIYNLITQQIDAAKRCMPNDCANEQALFEYSFIVAPLLDSLAKSYVNWDLVNVLDVHRIMYFWRPDARTVSMNWMSAEFLHNWNVCRNRILHYGLTFPSSNQ